MKSILVPVIPEADASRAALAMATALMRRGGKHIAGVGYAGIEFMAVGELFSESEVTLFEERRRAADVTAQRIFLAAMESAGIAAAAGADAHHTWIGLDASRAMTIPEMARAFDVTVVGRPGPRPVLGATPLLEGCLFESGGPILVVPPGHDGTVGDNVAIAWNGSSETGRTIAFGMPLLRTATKITVVQIDTVGVTGPSAEDIAARLRRHDLPAVAKTAPLANRNPGEAFLREAEGVGANLMIKGAYTQSRLRQMIFGGATAYLLAQSSMPMLMAH